MGWAPDQTKKLFVVTEFLNNFFEKTENKTKIIQSSEKFFKNDGLTSKEINLLYLGEEGVDKKTKEYLSKTSYENK